MVSPKGAFAESAGCSAWLDRVVQQNDSETESVRSHSDEKRALPANICPFSLSILIGFRRIAADHFSQNSRRKSKPKPQGDMD
jgi:hypothetical protein